MTIETKYTIGDKVYALHDKVVEGRVELVKAVYSEYRDKPDITYNVRFGNDLYIEFEKDLFPTKEMRDAFYENFKDLIESCKELL